MKNVKPNPELEVIIRTAIAAYPDLDLCPVCWDNLLFSELIELARANSFGDTLLSFVIVELYEGLEPEADMKRAVNLMSRGLSDLVSVRNALVRMIPTEEKPDE